MNPVIIIGSGLAGYTLAREFRKLNKAAPLLIVTANDGGFYSKPMLSNAFAQGKQAAELLTQPTAQMAKQLGVTILSGVRVESVDTGAMTVTTSAGVFAYGKLVLAVGAQPIRLAIDGNAADAVMSVNHIDDYQHFRQRIAASGPRARITILGAGLIGCEFADDLAGAGHHVNLVDPSKAPLAALAPPALSQGLRSALEARGVDLRLGTSAVRIDQAQGGLMVSLADGSMFEADVVLSAVGLRPDLRLAQEANLATARGVVVDAFGESSAPHVYALGDCAEYVTDDNGGRVLPYIAPLMTAARAIARTLDGQPTAIELKATPVIVKTPSFPLALLPPSPQAAASGTWRATSFGEHIVCRFHDENGCMRGFGVAPHDAKIRQTLLAELGSMMASAA